MNANDKPMRGRRAMGAAGTWLLAAALAASLAAQETAHQHSERGIQLAQRGNLAAAEAEFRSAARVDPNDPQILGNLGTVLAMEGKLEESNPILEKAIRLAPQALVLRQYLAANLWQLHKPAEAKTQLEILLKAHPQNKQAIFLLGMVSENLKDYTAAARLLASVPELVREHPQSVVALALSQYQTKNKDGARKTLEILLEHPDAPQAALMGARAATASRDDEEALRLLQAAEASNPGYPGLAYNIALAEYNVGRYADCTAKLLPLAGTKQDSGEVENQLGWCYEKQGKFGPAVSALRQAVTLAPDEESNYLDLSGVLTEGKLLPAALSVATEGIARYPKSARMWRLKGSIEISMSHYPDAMGSYSRAYQLDPTDAASLLGLGKAREGQGSAAEAEKTFEEGVQKFPRDPRFALEDALLLLRKVDAGDKAAKPRAVALLHKALAIDPQSAEAHYQLGNLALEDGRPKEAFNELHKAAQLEPDASRMHFALARACRRLGRNDEAAREMAVFQELKEKEQSVAYAAPAGMGSQ